MRLFEENLQKEIGKFQPCITFVNMIILKQDKADMIFEPNCQHQI